MSVTKEAKQVLIDRHGANPADTGRTEVQVAILSARITDLTGHLKIHSKDHSSRRSLLKLVGQRRRLLKYLRVEKLDVYRNLIVELGLRK